MHTHPDDTAATDCETCALRTDLDRLEARQAGLFAQVERLKDEAAELRRVYLESVLRGH